MSHLVGAAHAAAADGELWAVAPAGVPEIGPGADLGGLLAAACADAGVHLTAQDVLVVASKVVAKAEGRYAPVADRDRVLAAETVRVVAQRRLPDGRVTRVVQSRTGPVLAAAGIDASDVEPGSVLLLPADPDASARRLRARLRELTGTAPAVLVSDTSGRPWREGVTDFGLGAAGLRCLDDVRGHLDRFGRPLEVTVRAVADQIAAAADLARGKASGRPLAVVRGMGQHVTTEDGAGAAACVRTGPSDWFAHGHVEAVRASLGLGDDEVAAPPIDPTTPSMDERVATAVAVAAAGDALPGTTTTADYPADGAVVRVTGDPVRVGVMAQRIRSALWAEGVRCDLSTSATDAVLRLRA